MATNERTPLLNDATIINVTCGQSQVLLTKKKESRLCNGIFKMVCMALWSFGIVVNVVGGLIVEKLYY